jgi:quercetin dioxygenase-like cupin family protein
MEGYFFASVQEGRQVEMLPGVVRTTLCSNTDTMLCHFALAEGAHIPLHSHPAAQNGYVVRGRIRFFFEEGSIECGPGCGYLFEGGRKHGADVIEKGEFIECFTPSRPEYLGGP